MATATVNVVPNNAALAKALGASFTVTGAGPFTITSNVPQPLLTSVAAAFLNDAMGANGSGHLVNLRTLQAAVGAGTATNAQIQQLLYELTVHLLGGV